MNNLKILMLIFLFFSCKDNHYCETDSTNKVDSLNAEIRSLKNENRAEILELQNEVHRISVSLDSVKLK